MPSSDENKLIEMAKREAREASHKDATPLKQFPVMLSTAKNIDQRKLRDESCMADQVGQHSKRVDAALPGKHTKDLYGSFPWKERNVLAQLRTDMSRLNNTLH